MRNICELFAEVLLSGAGLTRRQIFRVAGAHAGVGAVRERGEGFCASITEIISQSNAFCKTDAWILASSRLLLGHFGLYHLPCAILTGLDTTIGGERVAGNQVNRFRSCEVCAAGLRESLLPEKRRRLCARREKSEKSVLTGQTGLQGRACVCIETLGRGENIRV